MREPRYSLWILEHESIYIVTAYKVKDTSSNKEVDEWMEKSLNHVASSYRDCDEINASYLQTFEY